MVLHPGRCPFFLMSTSFRNRSVGAVMDIAPGLQALQHRATRNVNG